jgi:hypothetical protein
MTPVLDLSRFWELLETNFPLAGPRSELRTRLGCDEVTALELGQVLAYLRIADAVACPHPGGPGCPRQVIQLSDGRFQGICGNDPSECEDVDLQQDDVEVMGVDPEHLCEALRWPLCIGGRVEPIPGLRNVFRAGTLKPDPATRHLIYLVVRSSEHEYTEAFDALRSQMEGQSFAVLVPTDRFIDSSSIRQMGTLGVPIIGLQGLVDVEPTGHLVTSADVLDLFGGIGRRATSGAAISAPIVAQVHTGRGWQGLDDAGYKRLLEAVEDFDIMADERSGTVWKREKEGAPHVRADGIQSSYFHMIRFAVDKIGYFDPEVHGPDDRAAGKQTFQRARKAIDVKHKAESGRVEWRLFKTRKVDDHAEYQFEPDPDYRYALIFLPRN